MEDRVTLNGNETLRSNDMKMPKIMHFGHFQNLAGIWMVLSLSFILCSCSPKAGHETEQVKNVIYKLVEADNLSDLPTVLECYTDSIEFYPAGRDFIKGIENVRKSYEKLFKENKLFISTSVSDTKIFGNDAVVKRVNKGTRMSLADSSVSDINDSYLAILKKDTEGEWRVDKLIWGNFK